MNRQLHLGNNSHGEETMKNLFKAKTVVVIYLAYAFLSGGTSYAASPNSDGTIDCSYAFDFHWINREGRTEVGQSQEGRWLKQFMYWPTENSLYWFSINPESTFELDTVFYNYKWTAYAKSFSGLVDSNLPRYYVDTQFSDDPRENNVGIGSAKASAIRAEKLYYYWGILESDGGPPNQDPDSRVKVIAQRGLRSPKNCYRAGCSFGCSSRGKHQQIPFGKSSAHPKRLLAPGCRLYYNDANNWWSSEYQSRSTECPDWNG